MPEVRRIYPMDGGEGHFVAKLIKKAKPQATQQMITHSLSRIKSQPISSHRLNPCTARFQLQKLHQNSPLLKIRL